MALNVFRILNSTVYTLLGIVTFCLTLLTPGDFIYQCYRNRRLTNIFIVSGVYIVTVLLALLVYASRIYTIRTGLGAIPKAWIPVAKGEVGKSVQRLVEDGIHQSAIVAYQARPRNLFDEHNEPAHDEDLSIKPDRPPWGPVSHAGWSSPSSLDLPGLRYQRVIEELPHLIEAKAVSLAPSDPLISSNRFADPSGSGDQNIPDPRVVEILQRPTAMGLRDYVGHLTTLGLIDPPELGAEFLSIYEQARFSPRPLVEDEFRSLMGLFAEILRGMKEVDPKVLQEIRGDGSQGDSESFIGPSDEEGETDTLGTEDLGESLYRRRSNNSSSPWGSSLRSVRTAPMVQSNGSPAQSRSTDRLRSGPSMTSLRRVGSNLSQNSAGSVIRLKLLRRGAEFLTPRTGSPATDGFTSASSQTALFPKVDPAVDGEDCDRDCASCTIHYPAKFDVELKDKLYGNVNGWATHVLVATGKADWVRDVADEKGSVMEAIDKGGIAPNNGKLKLSASNIPVPDEYHHAKDNKSRPTTVALFPAFTIIDHVTPALTPDLIKYFVNPSITTTTPLRSIPISSQPDLTGDSTVPTKTLLPAQDISSLTPLRSRPSPHAAVILLCSQKTRDARCGQSAPLLKREFERHLRSHGLYRDMDDERPGGVGVYFISHVGGHKYSANVIIYRRRDFDWYKKKNESVGEKLVQQYSEEDDGAVQGIWLARVRPEECENVVRFTVLQGKLVKPDQLRGGFDRERGLTSW
ncbi:sucrase/ferredoxin domain protein [Talaromyces proteolyticus]|uniref:Defect at low temperature protein 1 n=1 Tax=Talaromyces proteolyticus TaxID=1131652 RepID=A0AAD4KPQ6_9EURO|nr:sucrase/ferredoxin domain protein [Talaromyces proteolyticus]KAH8697612.1 sucrase/ferredoxin domain protein [Talaromyces proteolyticus]